MITQEYVKEAFDYDPITGVAKWRERPIHHFKNAHGQRIANTRYAGKPCSNTSLGYIVVKLAGSRQRLHRMVWLWYYGTMPALIIDHKNNDRSDNRISNLREADAAQNVQNTTKRPVGVTSKLKGVYWHKGAKRWKAQIVHANKPIT